ASAVIEGRARFRRQGRGLWLPIEAVTWHDLGRNHLADLRMGLGPVTFIRGMDGYLEGRGFSRISHTLDMGPEIDQAAALFMWAEAILFPEAWRGRDDVGWSAVDDETTDIALPMGEERIPARVTFERRYGFPATFSAERYKGVGSRPVEWLVEYSEWRTTSDGVMLPSLATVSWSDEPGPWFRMWIARANPDADVSGAMERGRTLLAQVDADPTR
ncbi:MAG: DUF6544 family protein, partial [Candidatus Limnocylindrales bacterium]